MRRIAIFVLLLSTLASAQIRGRHRLVTASGGQTPTLLTTSPTIGTCGSATCTATSGAIDTTGATLLIIQVDSYSAVPSSVGDSQGNTYTALTNRIQGTANTQLFYSCGPTANATMTFHATGGYVSVIASAWSGTKTASCFDVEAGTGCASAITCQYASFTPSQNNSLIIAGWSANTGATWTIDTGFTIGTNMSVYNGSIESGAMSYLVQGAAAAITPTWSGSATNSAIAIASFKPGP